MVLGFCRTAEELSAAASELRAYLETLTRVPIEVRRFVGAVATRMHRMRRTGAVRRGELGTKVLLADLRSAFRLGELALRTKITQLEAYGIGDGDIIETDMGGQPALHIRALRSGWRIWPDIIKFCEATKAGIEAITDDLDFFALQLLIHPNA